MIACLAAFSFAILASSLASLAPSSTASSAINFLDCAIFWSSCSGVMFMFSNQPGKSSCFF
uniref:Uncharacterized protein n=1 Tax=uncultured marine virus TaxID=186617 RepID=A0A0F7L5S4_9VIRU|nr:hypothetical protein [uncultured marine virus]